MNDLFVELQDGTKLLYLLQVLTGQQIVRNDFNFQNVITYVYF